MTQALEKVKMTPKRNKMSFFAQQMVMLFKTSVFGEIQFSQKSLTNRTKQPHTYLQQVHAQQTQMKF